MKFEEILSSLHKRGILLDHVGQIEDGTVWSSTVRKKGTTSIGYGQGKSIEVSIKASLAAMRDRMSPTEWAKLGAEKNPGIKKKKRVKLRN